MLSQCGLPSSLEPTDSCSNGRLSTCASTHNAGNATHHGISLCRLKLHATGIPREGMAGMSCTTPYVAGLISSSCSLLHAGCVFSSSKLDTKHVRQLPAAPAGLLYGWAKLIMQLQGLCKYATYVTDMHISAMCACVQITIVGPAGFLYAAEVTVRSSSYWC